MINCPRFSLWLVAALPFLTAGPGQSAVTNTPAAAAGSLNRFDLAERKQRQPWLWQAPRPTNPPSVRDRRWPASAEDRFVLSRLESEGLRPAPPADDRTWLRRVHFVITGLPPRRDEIEMFLADRTPAARERVVDRLLASPHFGERWARHWMDLMRYAETRGHEGDYHIANAWHYRDYLIRALNADVPYDQFLTEQLAGDLMAAPRFRDGKDGNPANESVLGTGWAFLGEENHSPVDIRQDECERIDNKVDVFSKTFLGLTVSCARCHDHKFDPISSQDYYALTGFMLGSSFRQVRFEAMENNRRRADELEALRAEHLPRIAAAVAQSREPGLRQLAMHLRQAGERLRAAPGTSNNASADPWLVHLRQAATNQWHPLHRFAQQSIDRATTNGAPPATAPAQPPSASAGLPMGARVIADFGRPEHQPWKADGEAFGRAPARLGDRVLGSDPANPIARVMSYGAARRDLFWNRLKTAPGNENDSGRLGATARAGQMIRTPTFTLEDGHVHYLIRGRTRVYAAVDSHLMNEGPLHARLGETFDGGTELGPRWVTHDLTPYRGHRTHMEFGPDGPGELEILMVVESAERPTWRPDSGVVEPSATRPSLDDFAREIQRAALAANEQLGQAKPAPGWTAQSAALANWIAQNPALFPTEPSQAVTSTIAAFLSAQSNLASRVQWESRTAVAWFDGTGVDENVLVRGKPFKPGALAPRSLPVAFPGAKPIPTAGSSGRLELARQLVDPANPLVSRVIVNRVWHHVFGRGLVPTVDNFGALGERPTHPELLDHLAWQFAHDDGWSVKRLIRRLVLTRAFGQSSRLADAKTEERDPSNALLHRMSVRRLEGEVIRDALLTVSGRLNPVVGGPPITVHLTEFLVGRGRPDQSGPLDGDGRRSIYTAMRRNFLPTLPQTFDAPTPFSTVGRRNVTNVPGQSLALMNDPLFHQQARVWIERLLRETKGADDVARLRWLFETAYGRLPDKGEIKACRESLAELRDLEQKSGSDEIGPWSDLGHALLNANEFIYVP